MRDCPVCNNTGEAIVLAGKDVDAPEVRSCPNCRPAPDDARQLYSEGLLYGVGRAHAGAAHGNPPNTAYADPLWLKGCRDGFEMFLAKVDSLMVPREIGDSGAPAARDEALDGAEVPDDLSGPENAVSAVLGDVCIDCLESAVLAKGAKP